jgi:hypothetical protein
MCRELAISPALLNHPKKDDQPAVLPQRLEKLIERSLPDPTAKLQKRLKAIEKSKSA